MLKLCGYPASNYYNKVKLALLEKGVPFEEELHGSSREALAGGSAAGKVPFVETPQGVFCESQAIIEYIEETHPDPPLYPRDAFARARCRELIHFIELYLELPARRLYPEAYFGGSVSDETKAAARADLDKGVQALAERARFSPFIAGAELTYADCAACIHLPLVAQCTRKIYGEDLVARVPGVVAYLEQMRTRPHAKKVNEDRKADLERTLAARRQSA